jgi:hypothetical protein
VFDERERGERVGMGCSREERGEVSEFGVLRQDFK